MMKTIAVLALVALCASSAHAGWIATADKSMCAGIVDPCDSKESCTKVMLGPCDAGTANTTNPKASAYLESSLEGIAFVADKKYYACESETCDHIFMIHMEDDANNGYRDAKAEAGKYGFSMVGARYGDFTKAGGYLGSASYINLGTTAIKTNSVDIYYADANGQARVDRSGDDGSSIGAPKVAEGVCISTANGAACGPDREFPPNAYKFSLFGGTFGPEFKDHPEVAKKNPTHLGIRMKLKAVGFKVDDLLVDGAAIEMTPGATGYHDVKKITIKPADGAGIEIDFPKKYNVGGTENAGGKKAPEKTKDVVIHATSDAASLAKQEIFIDYLFDFADLNDQGRYFIYDPDVKAIAKDEKVVTASKSGAVAQALSAVSLLAAAAAVGMQ